MEIIMADKTLNQIIKLCLSLEYRAYKIYRSFSLQATKDNLKGFWKEMANQELEHYKYWKKLLHLAEMARINNIFDDPDKIVEELKEIKKKIDKKINFNKNKYDLTTSFLIAYQLEFYLLHPAFEAIFYLMKNETETSPMDDYENHIKGLICKLKGYGNHKPEFDLIANLLAHLWKANRQLALQLAHIKSLRGMIPICMHCKNIRNDSGYWEGVENYISDHSEVTFTHGICPDCIKKYYSKFYKVNEINAQL
jgi:rubrerythrin